MSPASRAVLVKSTVRPVDSAGRFETIGFPPGRYTLAVGQPMGWSVRSISAGGRVLRDGVIELGTEDVSDVVVSMTDRRNEVSGTVRSSDGKPVRDCAVFVFPVSRSLWNAYGVSPPRVVQVHPDGGGRFVVRGLPADEYYVVAAVDDVPDRWQNPAYLTTLVPAAVKSQVTDSSRLVVDLKADRRK